MLPTPATGRCDNSLRLDASAARSQSLPEALAGELLAEWLGAQTAQRGDALVASRSHHIDAPEPADVMERECRAVIEAPPRAQVRMGQAHIGSDRESARHSQVQDELQRLLGPVAEIEDEVLAPTPDRGHLVSHGFYGRGELLRGVRAARRHAAAPQTRFQLGADCLHLWEFGHLRTVPERDGRLRGAGRFRRLTNERQAAVEERPADVPAARAITSIASMMSL